MTVGTPEDDQHMDEEWRAVVGWEGLYEVSDQGRVRSLPRPTRNWPVILRPGVYDKVGHLMVVLHGPGRRHTRAVHKIVAEAFLGPCPGGLEVCHGNGQAADNAAANLRYDTRSSNTYDKIKHGWHPFASRTHCSNDHEYTEENTAWRMKKNPQGKPWRYRDCRQCARERAQQYRDEAKESA